MLRTISIDCVTQKLLFLETLLRSGTPDPVSLLQYKTDERRPYYNTYSRLHDSEMRPVAWDLHA